MQLGMIGLGRMGANMVRRLMLGGHQCVVYDKDSKAVDALTSDGANPALSIDDLVHQLTEPRAVWLMVPAAVVDSALKDLLLRVKANDVIIDGGNSYFADDITRSKELKSRGVHYVDVGTSGGVWGLERGYCQMIGGEKEIIERLDPIFKALAPGCSQRERTHGREGAVTTAEEGYLHCGPAGAGHFAKMVHNGIEYGLMAAYSEGLNILRHANVGKDERSLDAETTPLRNPEFYKYDFNLTDVTELWRHGSVVSSWLLDLIAKALLEQPDLTNFSGHVSDSGEGRWTVACAIEESVPAPVLSAALYQRFTSRGKDEFAARLLSAMRFEFGGHVEKQDES